MVDMPDVPPQYAPVMIVQVSQAKQSADKADHTIGVCSLVGNPMRPEAINGVGPIAAATAYFLNAGNHEAVGRAVVRVLSNPQHGTLEPNADAPGGYVYLPKTGYFGPDRATFLVEMRGKTVRMEYFFKVSDGGADGDYEDKKLCPKGISWKISSNPTTRTAA
jgi:hypothetical protein